MASWTAAIAYVNKADDGTITAGNSLTTTPPSRLQNAHVGRTWRSQSNSDYLTIDLGSSQSFDTIALLGTNLTAAGLTRARASLTDTSAVTGDVYDSTSAAARVDPDYGALIILIASPVTARYLRIDLSDSSLSYVEAGRLFVGLRTQFTNNFAVGWARAWVDLSRKTKGRGGQTFVDALPKFRTVDLTFEGVSATQRNALIEAIDVANGARTDVLLITNPDSTNLGRDSIWGLMQEIGPVIETSADLFSRSYKIEERL